jgi:hypothetical protein
MSLLSSTPEEIEAAQDVLTIRAMRLQRLMGCDATFACVKCLCQGKFAEAADHARAAAEVDLAYSHLAIKLAEDMQKLVTA